MDVNHEDTFVSRTVIEEASRSLACRHVIVSLLLACTP